MSLPSRVVPDFVPGNVVKSQEFDDEFSRLYGILKGDNLGISIRVVNSDNAFACARFDQTGTGVILELFGSGAQVFKFDKNAGMFSTRAGKTWAHTVNASGELVIGEDGVSNAITIAHTTGLVTLTNMKTAWSVSPWSYPVLPGAIESVESVGRYIVPGGTEIQIIDIVAVWAAGADSGASNIFTIKRRNSVGTLQTDVGTIDINTPAQNNVQVTTLGAPLTLTAGDQLYPLLTTRNTASEQLISIGLRGKQKLTT